MSALEEQWPEHGPVIEFATMEDCQRMFKILQDMNQQIIELNQRIAKLEIMAHHKNWTLGPMG